jgi:cellulase/cellobiase CelA1
LIDPIGFAFEHFDGIGRYRDRDGPHAIDARGQIRQTANSDADFEGVQGLAEVLAQSDDVRRCYVQQWVRYAYAADDSLAVDCYADSLANEVAADGDELRAAMLALVRTAHFVRRSGGVGELDVPGAELTPAAPGQPPEVEDPPPVIEDPPEEEPDQDLVFELTEQSRWPTGYCANGSVTNQGNAEARWVVEAEIEGVINNAWNVEISANAGRVEFSGVGWNALIGPGQSADFGFCAEL